MRSSFSSVAVRRPLESVLQRLDVGVASVGPEETPAAGEWGVIRLGAVTSGTFRPEQVKRWPKSRRPQADLEITRGDVLVVRVNGAPKLVGSVCRVGEVPPHLMLSDLVMRLVPDPAVMEPAFLALVLSSTDGRRQIEARMRGTKFAAWQSPHRWPTLGHPELRARR